MPLLHVTCRDGKIFDFPLEKEKIVIGRNEDNDLVLPDPLASRHHSEIIKEKKGYVLKDLGSHNGTKVNGKLIQEVRLKEQDKIQIGQYKLVFLIKEETPDSKTEGFVLAGENNQEDWQQQTIRINPQKSCLQDSGELLATIVPGKQQEILARSVSSFPKKDTVDAGADLSALERMNKVLFVLYEVSRQLN